MNILPRKRLSGMTLVEAVMALGLAVTGMATVFLINAQCLRILRAGKEFAAASQGLQERVEQLRIANWRQSTDPNWLTSTNFLGIASASSVNLPPIEERCRITIFPSGTSTASMEIIRDSNGLRTEPSAPDVGALFGSRMIRVDLRISWEGSGRGDIRTYETSAILSNGGVSR
jgi:hypothetical protein